MTQNDLFKRLYSDAPKPAEGEKPAEEQPKETPTKGRSAAAYLESLKNDSTD